MQNSTRYLIRALAQIVSDRVVIEPIFVSNPRTLIEYLEENGTRIRNAWTILGPLLILHPKFDKKHFYFFEDGRRLLIRYRSRNLLRPSSLCFFSGKIEREGSEYVLRGSHRFPLWVDVPKYMILALAPCSVLAFVYMAVSRSVTIVDILIFPMVLVAIPIMASWWGNVTSWTSFFAKHAIKRVDELLADYKDHQKSNGG